MFSNADAVLEWWMATLYDIGHRGEFDTGFA